MARLPGLLKRTSKEEQLELEIARQVSVARLERILAQRAGLVVQDDEDPAGPGVEESLGRDVENRLGLDAALSALGEVPIALGEGSSPAIEVATHGTPERAAAQMASEPAVPEGDRQPVTAEAPARKPATGSRPAIEVHPAGVPVMASDAVDATRRRAVHRVPAVLVAEDSWDEATTGAGELKSNAAMIEMAAPEPSVSRPVEQAQDLEAVPEANIEPAPVVAAAFTDAAPPTSDVTLPVGDAPPSLGDVESAVTGQSSPVPQSAPVPAKPRTRVRSTVKAAAAGVMTPEKVSTKVPEKSPAKTSAKGPVVSPPPPPRVRAVAEAPAHPKRATRQPRLPAVLAACPSCAVLLDPRPTVSRRCSQCRERIVVRRLEGGVLYLTTAAAEALDAAQRRLVETTRLTRTRGRWLAQASMVGASPASIERIGRVVATEDGVQAARTLYLAAAERAFRASRRERRFAEAASIRRTQVTMLLRDLGRDGEIADDLVALHRDAQSADLRALREFGREVELVAAPCCEACAIDNGLVARITDESKLARLPHAGCPARICRCRWVAARVAGRRPVVKTAAAR